MAEGGGQDHRQARRLAVLLRLPGRALAPFETTNPIGSTFATVRLRTKITKGPSSKAAGLAMAFKLIKSAQDRWRCVNGSHLVALVRAGAVFGDGVIIERAETGTEQREVAAPAMTSVRDDRVPTPSLEGLVIRVRRRPSRSRFGSCLLS